MIVSKVSNCRMKRQVILMGKISRQVLLFLLIFYFPISVCFCNSSAAMKDVYVMLDMDGTLVDRIDSNDKLTMERIHIAGFRCHNFKFRVQKEKNIKFYSWYKKMLDNMEIGQAHKLNITRIDKNTLEVEETVVLRPALIDFIEKLDKLNSPLVSIKFFIVSRNDDIRNQALIDNLDIFINGQPFKNKVRLIPRANFRVHLSLGFGEMVPGKDAALLREKLKNEKNIGITPGTYMFFIDNIIPERFVIGNKELDKLLCPTRFTISSLNKVDIKKDLLAFRSIFGYIQKSINVSSKQ